MYSAKDQSASLTQRTQVTTEVGPYTFLDVNGVDTEAAIHGSGAPNLLKTNHCESASPK